MRFVTWLLSTAAALAVATWLIPGIYFTGPTSGAEEIRHKLGPLLLVALIMGIITMFVKPVVTLLSLPLVVLTLGLFLVIINALMLALTAWIAGLFGIGFHVDGFWAAVFGAVVVSIVNIGIEIFVLKDRTQQ